MSHRSSGRTTTVDSWSTGPRNQRDRSAGGSSPAGIANMLGRAFLVGLSFWYALRSAHCRALTENA